ncbi:hypothetical protein ACLK1Y_13800 [Escherichia coli]
MKGELPVQWAENIQHYIDDLQANPASLATRQVSQRLLKFFRRYDA